METLKLNSTFSTDVMLLQSILKKIGYYNFAIDGIFGINTERAVKNFQRDFGLTPDGIVGPKTLEKLMPYINGYTTYKIKKGDTFYNIAQNFNTTVDALIFANPLTNYNNLIIDEEIIVPFSSIVPTDVNYTSKILSYNLNSFQKVYPFLSFEIIGRTVLGKPITAIKFGNGKKEIFYNAAIHANEWITSTLLMKFLENLCKSYVNNTNIYGINPRDIFSDISLYIVPMINLDGVDLVTGLLDKSSYGYNLAEKIAYDFPSIPFPSGYKSNIEGIDLNLQFPADWEKAKEIKYAQGYDKPAPRDFVGFGPLTAPESTAIYSYILRHTFEIMHTYHTQGRVIFYEFQGNEPQNSKEIAETFSKASGYSVSSPEENSSYAGLKDWFILYYKKPGFTIEAGIGINPLPLSQFDSIYRENLGILINGLLV